MSERPLEVRSMGLVCCVGHDVLTAAASVRAGIARRAPLEGRTQYDAATLEQSISGAAIAGLTGGFLQTGTWMRLALLALADLVRQGDLPGPSDRAFWNATGLIWVIPELTYERFMWPEDQIPELLDRCCAEVLRDMTELPFHTPVTFLPLGPAGVAAAASLLSRGLDSSIRRAIVLGTDSWIDPLSIEWLAVRNRLKTDDQLQGLVPGEAASALLLEERQKRPTSSDITRTVLLGAAICEAPPLEALPPAAAQPVEGADDSREGSGAHEGSGFLASRAALVSALGQNVARAVLEALGKCRLDGPFRGEIYLDLNGEDWKALAWGHAQSRLAGAIDFGASRVRLPAVQLGDTGAAGGVAALCFAARSFIRRYAVGHHALICSISDSGRVGAVVMGAAPD